MIFEKFQGYSSKPYPGLHQRSLQQKAVLVRRAYRGLEAEQPRAPAEAVQALKVPSVAEVSEEFGGSGFREQDARWSVNSLGRVEA